MRSRYIRSTFVWAGDSLDQDGNRDLSSNVTPIPLDAAGRKRAGLNLTEKATKLLGSLCLSDRIVPTGADPQGCAGALPPEVGELQAAGVALSIRFARIADGIFVARIRMDHPPFDLIDPVIRF